MKNTLIFLCGLMLLGLTGYAGNSIYVALKARAPIEMSCADYFRNRPDGIWLKLDNCQVDFERLVQVGHIDYFAPITDDVAAHHGVLLMLKLSEKADIDLAWDLFLAPGPVEAPSPTHTGSATDHDSADLLERLRERMAPRRIEVLFRSGLDADDKDRRTLETSDLEFEKHWGIVDEGGPPSLVLGILLLTPGLILAGLIIAGLIILRRDRKTHSVLLQTVAEASAPAQAIVVDITKLVSRVRSLHVFGWIARFILFVMLGGSFAIVLFFELSDRLPIMVRILIAIAAVFLTTSLFFRLQNPRITAWLALLAMIFYPSTQSSTRRPKERPRTKRS